MDRDTLPEDVCCLPTVAEADGSQAVMFVPWTSAATRLPRASKKAVLGGALLVSRWIVKSCAISSALSCTLLGKLRIYIPMIISLKSTYCKRIENLQTEFRDDKAFGRVIEIGVMVKHRLQQFASWQS